MAGESSTESSSGSESDSSWERDSHSGLPNNQMQKNEWGVVCNAAVASYIFGTDSDADSEDSSDDEIDERQPSVTPDVGVQSDSAVRIISEHGGQSENRLKTMTAAPGGAGPNNGRRLRVTAHSDGELLPGIPNDITLGQISPRLPWISELVLSLVSRAWFNAVRGHQVYNARVRSNLTETLALIKSFPSPDVHVIALYSMRDNAYFELPPIPSLDRGIPQSCECLSVDGKVYVLGGEYRKALRDLCEVYVLDLAAGEGRWKQCASMQEPRQGFGCGAINGKIYVFGGYVGDSRVPVLSSELYDPKENMWSPIWAMASLRVSHHVTRIGEELFVHGGRVFGDEYFAWVQRVMDSGKEFIDRVMELRDMDSDDESDDGTTYISDDDSLEVYHPARDVWRTVEHFHTRPSAPVFVAQGKFHSMVCTGIEVYDIDRNVWSYLHSHSFPGLGAVDRLVIVPVAVLAVDDGLLAIVQYLGAIDHKGGTCLVRSRGLGGVNKEIVWEKVDVCLSFLSWPPKRYFMYPVQL